MNFFIRNACLLTGEERIEKGCLQVKGSTLEYVGPEKEGLIKAGDHVIDAEGNVIMPGFVNGHTHLAMTLLRGCADDMPLRQWLFDHIFPLEDQLTPQDVYWGSLLGIAEMIAGGTTAFNDMYFFEEETAKAVDETGIRAVLGIGIMGQDESDDKKIQTSKAFFQEFNGFSQGRITVKMAPHAEYTCSKTFLQKVIAVSSQLQSGIHIHVSETKSEVEECKKRYGMSPVAFLNEIGIFDLPTIAAHGVWLSPEDIAILAKKNVTVVHNPTSNLKLGSGIAPVEELLKAHVPVALGTDSVASNNNLDMFEEMRLCALLQKGKSLNAQILPAHQALSIACAEGAKALGLKTGLLKKGLKADFIMVNLHTPHLYPHTSPESHMVYAANGHDVKMTVVDGQILYENGHFKTLDIEKIYGEVERIKQRLYPFR